jgi:hypothetical protein
MDVLDGGRVELHLPQQGHGLDGVQVLVEEEHHGSHGRGHRGHQLVLLATRQLL